MIIKVYGCRLYDGEKMVKNYKPCKNSDGVEGMFDVITGEFLNRDAYIQMVLQRYRRCEEIIITTKGEW